MSIIISVIVPTHNRHTALIQCLRALATQRFPSEEYEVIVVDDGSTDRTIETVQALAEEIPVRIIVLRQARRGPAAARNLGVRHAQGKFVAFLDDDSVPEPDWLAEMVSAFDNAPNVGGVSGRRVARAEPGTLASLIEKYIYTPQRSVATNNIAYRKVVVDLVGGFDEKFPVPAWEDVDLAARVQDRGYRIIFSDHAIVTHPCEGDWPTFRRKGIINGLGLAYFVRKYLFRRPQRALFHLAYELWHLVYFPWWVIGWPGGERGIARRLRFARACDTLHGILQGWRAPAPTMKNGS